MDVRQVAKLAHLEITDDEVALYTPQMANIVKYVEQLNEIDHPTPGGRQAVARACDEVGADAVPSPNRVKSGRTTAPMR